MAAKGAFVSCRSTPCGEPILDNPTLAWLTKLVRRFEITGSVCSAASSNNRRLFRPKGAKNAGRSQERLGHRGIAGGGGYCFFGAWQPEAFCLWLRRRSGRVRADGISDAGRSWTVRGAVGVCRGHCSRRGPWNTVDRDAVCDRNGGGGPQGASVRRILPAAWL